MGAGWLLLAAAPVLADEAERVAPFVGPDDVFIARLDLRQPEVATAIGLFGMLGPQFADAIGPTASVLSSLPQAGVQELFILNTALPGEATFVVPLSKGVDVAAATKALELSPLLGVARVKDTLVTYRTATTEEEAAAQKRFAEMQRSTAPAAGSQELANDLRSVGDAPFKVAVRVGKTSWDAIEQQAADANGPYSLLMRIVGSTSHGAVGFHYGSQAEIRALLYPRPGQTPEQLASDLGKQIASFLGSSRTRGEFPQWQKLEAAARPATTQEGGVEIKLNEANGGLPAFVSTLEQMREIYRAAAARVQSLRLLSRLGVALAGASLDRQAFPAPASYSEAGQPLLSWRVHLLPLLDQELLYGKFRLDEPWDSPHNKQLLGEMPDCFRCPDSKVAQEGKTVYLMVRGKGAMFERRGPVPVSSLRKGLSNSVALVEVADSEAIEWTRPDDWPFDPKQPTRGLRQRGKQRGAYLCADGSVMPIGPESTDDQLRALFRVVD